jgi:hypothetical protein
MKLAGFRGEVSRAQVRATQASKAHDAAVSEQVNRTNILEGAQKDMTPEEIQSAKDAADKTIENLDKLRSDITAQNAPVAKIATAGKKIFAELHRKNFINKEQLTELEGKVNTMQKQTRDTATARRRLFWIMAGIGGLTSVPYSVRRFLQP